MANRAEELLEINRTLLELDRRLHTARVVRRSVRSALVGLPFLAFCAYALYVSPDFGVGKKLIGTPLGIAIALLAIGLLVYGAQRFEGDVEGPGDLELQIVVQRERKAYLLSQQEPQLKLRQYAYHEEIASDLETLRRGAVRYRRINNFLQAVIIVGSLAATSMTSLALSEESLRWASVGTTFAVGLAAGFTGYFKFRERSFYLQQTADAIEYERNCFGIGIGRYKGKSQELALLDLVEEVERLRAEQRKREQNIDQPPERDE
ncbi:SLATT domain-containing protein [Kribbella sp. VKM Ac-2571]|uniref:SLATT domain-containing protein n=1 Tax=Kribbella sp. VKM Ac-2571 TaxID=2512222 RepID=UPI00192E2247|nr:SLATT domain-containing protein [Kribbella sp. VKM Ac-2571]